MSAPVPPATQPSAQSSVSEDTANEPSWVRDGKQGYFGAHWTFTAGVLVILILALIVAGFDIYVVLDRGLGLFDETLLAEADAVLAIVAVVGGTFAAWQVLRPKGPKEG
jgi:hypothetical protein